MQTVAIISQDSKKRMDYALKLCDEHHVSNFDRTIIKREEIPTKTGAPKFKQSIGIEEVKQLQKTLSYKAFQGEYKAIIIDEAHLLTTEAQNALLKVLEEPPVHTVCMLLSETIEALLPTVRSRCVIVGLDSHTFTQVPTDDITELIEAIPEWGIGKALVQAEKLAKRKEDAISFLEACIQVFRSKLLAESMSEKPHEVQIHEYRKLIDRFDKTRREISSTNVNLRLSLENLFLAD